METLSDFGSHLEVLMGCLLPVANSLSHTLIPWAQKAEPLRRQWMLQMEALSPNQFVSQVLRANVPWEIQGVDAAIVYFVPGWLLPGVNQQNQHLKLLIGADRMPQRTCAEELEPWEYLAFRLPDSAHRKGGLTGQSPRREQVSLFAHLRIRTACRRCVRMAASH